MTSIKIRRFTNHPAGNLGALLPEDGRWRLVIDKDGVPHLFLRVYLAPDVPGWLNVDDLLPEHHETGKRLEIGDLIDATCAGEDVPADEGGADIASICPSVS